MNQTELQKEAELYRTNHPSPMNTGGNIRTINAFIMGANSKSVQIDKLSFAIEQLKDCINYHKKPLDASTQDIVEDKLEELESQLTNLKQ